MTCAYDISIGELKAMGVIVLSHNPTCLRICLPATLAREQLVRAACAVAVFGGPGDGCDMHSDTNGAVIIEKRWVYEDWSPNAL